jgi:hypothetical protein
LRAGLLSPHGRKNSGRSAGRVAAKNPRGLKSLKLIATKLRKVKGGEFPICLMVVGAEAMKPSGGMTNFE